jgi:predicted AlkP superfamily pyrophosphatase or phosphodiesterase
MYDMRVVAPSVSYILGIRPPRSADSVCLPLTEESMRRTNKLLVVVLDAFGVSTWKKAEHLTPTLNQLEKVHSTVIHSVMKSITPVNFATMLTGASPEVHGITDRSMPLKHETIFDVMRETGLRSATAARAVSSLGILISPHADQPGIAESNLDDEVVEIAVSQLLDGFNFVWVQFLDADDAGHAYGPVSEEGLDAAARVDANLRIVLNAAHVNGYSVMVLADHGQHMVDEDRYKGSHGTEVLEDIEVPFLWDNNDELVFLDETE